MAALIATHSIHYGDHVETYQAPPNVDKRAGLARRSHREASTAPPKSPQKLRGLLGSAKTA